MIGVDRVHDLVLAGHLTSAEGAELLDAQVELARWRRWRRAGRVARVIAWIAVVVAWYAIVLGMAGAFATGCGSSSASSAAKVTPAQADLMPMPWCASVLFTNGQARRGCAPTLELCEVDSEKLRQAGVMASIRWVGTCRRWP